MNEIKVGLFGGALSSVNYGVTALTLTQIQMLEDLGKELSVHFSYLVFSDDSQASVQWAKTLLGVQDLAVKYIVRLKTGLPGILRLRKDIQKCDIVIDLTYGDSFSDIYGKKNFYLYSIPKLVAIGCKKILVLAPQTIGPYYGKIEKALATYILKKVDHIIARDTLSFDCAHEVSGRKDIIQTSDLAMDLPYDSEEKRLKRAAKEGCVNVGLNISSLLWYKDASNSHLSVTLSYRELTDRLINLCRSKKYCVHLIAHVYEGSGSTEYDLASEIAKKYPDVILAPYFHDPIEAKNYMSQLDIFIGARMHATIGAFSSGVPVIPIAYSRKFEGLYSSVGYRYCIDCSNETVDSAIQKITDWFDDMNRLQATAVTALAEAKSRNRAYFDLLKRIVLNITN